MKGGRLKIVNESGYADGEVEALVQFGLSEIDLTGERIVAVVKRNKQHAVSGTAYSLHDGIPSTLYDRYCGARTTTAHLIVLRVGSRESFPARSWRRYAGVPQREYRDWREGLVAITAHEGKHAEHVHDGAYMSRSGWRRPAMFTDPETGKQVPFRRGGLTRVGVERIEPKCEAFENVMLRRFREAPAWLESPQFATV